MNNEAKIAALKQLLKELQDGCSLNDYGDLVIYPSRELMEKVVEAIKA
jgi:hypothetical protein